jgi:hypothetical protein
LSLIDAGCGCAKQHNYIEKDNAIGGKLFFFDNSLFGTGLNSANEFCILTLPLIKSFVALVATVGYPGLII